MIVRAPSPVNNIMLCEYLWGTEQGLQRKEKQANKYQWAVQTQKPKWQSHASHHKKCLWLWTHYLPNSIQQNWFEFPVCLFGLSTLHSQNEILCLEKDKVTLAWITTLSVEVLTLPVGLQKSDFSNSLFDTLFWWFWGESEHYLDLNSLIALEGEVSEIGNQMNKILVWCHISGQENTSAGHLLIFHSSPHREKLDHENEWADRLFGSESFWNWVSHLLLQGLNTSTNCKVLSIAQGETGNRQKGTEFAQTLSKAKRDL